MQKISMKYARNMLWYAVTIQLYVSNMQVYANNMQEIKICNYNYIHCISPICKKYLVEICRNMQLYMHNMLKSIYCIFFSLSSSFPTNPVLPKIILSTTHPVRSLLHSYTFNLSALGALSLSTPFPIFKQKWILLLD